MKIKKMKKIKSKMKSRIYPFRSRRLKTAAAVHACL